MDSKINYHQENKGFEMNGRHEMKPYGKPEKEIKLYEFMSGEKKAWHAKQKAEKESRKKTHAERASEDNSNQKSR